MESRRAFDGSEVHRRLSIVGQRRPNTRRGEALPSVAHEIWNKLRERLFCVQSFAREQDWRAGGHLWLLRHEDSAAPPESRGVPGAYPRGVHRPRILSLDAPPRREAGGTGAAG